MDYPIQKYFLNSNQKFLRLVRTTKRTLQIYNIIYRLIEGAIYVQVKIQYTIKFKRIKFCNLHFEVGLMPYTNLLDLLYCHTNAVLQPQVSFWTCFSQTSAIKIPVLIRVAFVNGWATECQHNVR